ncbi:MAG: type I methionyl aminopeptidase [bacterium]|nr:type I methionyl aminopeptidase [bacterium]
MNIKTEAEIEIMHEGGRKLARVRDSVLEKVGEGVRAWDIEELAVRLIKKEKAKASFKMVKGYSWATCVNLNEGLVHGIPTKNVVFKKGDVVSVDLGIYYNGFHTDTSFTKAIDPDSKTANFLQVGKTAMKKAIEKTRVGNYVYDISEAIETSIRKAGFSPIKALVGHGVGRNLHEEPQIPCFVPGVKESSSKLPVGAVLAIEVMYCMGQPDVVINNDGWTISTADGKISALFEDTVAVTNKGPMVLTALE